MVVEKVSNRKLLLIFSITAQNYISHSATPNNWLLRSHRNVASPVNQNMSAHQILKLIHLKELDKLVPYVMENSNTQTLIAKLRRI